MSELYNNDNELFRRIVDGDEKAFRALFEKYYSPLTIFADKIISDTDSAIDIVQSLFVSIYEQRKTLKIVAIKPFLYQSVKNRCLNEIKHRKIHNNFAEGEIATFEETTNETEDLIEVAELESRLTAVINTLAPQCKRIFQMSRFEGKSNTEIAEELQLSKRTVETQISKALLSIRNNLGDLFSTIAILYQLL